MTQADLLKQADEIYGDYLKNRYSNNAFHDAAVSLLWLITRLLIARDGKRAK